MAVFVPSIRSMLGFRRTALQLNYQDHCHSTIINAFVDSMKTNIVRKKRNDQDEAMDLPDYFIAESALHGYEQK